MNGISSTRLARRGVLVAIAGLLVANGIAFYRIGTSATPISDATAIARFRASTKATPPVGPVVIVPDTPAATATPAAAASAPAAGAANVATAAAGQPSKPSAPHGSAAAAAPAAPAGPSAVRTPAGVYTYQTSGQEHVSVGTGASHDYPATTHVTVTETPCGATVRWDALEQRYDQWQTCTTGDDIRLQSFTTYHDFFGQVDKKEYACTPETALRPAGRQAGATFAGTCKAANAAAVLHGTVVGIENVIVGGQPVACLHVHIDEDLTGATKGTRTSESWYALTSNVLVERTAKTDADSDTAFGYTHYTETLSMMLVNLTPQR